jgi:hypothetical protein
MAQTEIDKLFTIEWVKHYHNDVSTKGVACYWSNLPRGLGLHPRYKLNHNLLTFHYCIIAFYPYIADLRARVSTYNSTHTDSNIYINAIRIRSTTDKLTCIHIFMKSIASFKEDIDNYFTECVVDIGIQYAFNPVLSIDNIKHAGDYCIYANPSYKTASLIANALLPRRAGALIDITAFFKEHERLYNRDIIFNPLSQVGINFTRRGMISYLLHDRNVYTGHNLTTCLCLPCYYTSYSRIHDLRALLANNPTLLRQFMGDTRTATQCHVNYDLYQNYKYLTVRRVTSQQHTASASANASASASASANASASASAGEVDYRTADATAADAAGATYPPRPFAQEDAMLIDTMDSPEYRHHHQLGGMGERSHPRHQYSRRQRSRSPSPSPTRRHRTPSPLTTKQRSRYGNPSPPIHSHHSLSPNTPMITLLYRAIGKYKRPITTPVREGIRERSQSPSPRDAHHEMHYKGGYAAPYSKDDSDFQHSLDTMLTTARVASAADAPITLTACTNDIATSANITHTAASITDSATSIAGSTAVADDVTELDMLAQLKYSIEQHSLKLAELQQRIISQSAT